MLCPGSLFSAGPRFCNKMTPLDEEHFEYAIMYFNFHHFKTVRMGSVYYSVKRSCHCWEHWNMTKKCVGEKPSFCTHCNNNSWRIPPNVHEHLYTICLGSRHDTFLIVSDSPTYFLFRYIKCWNVVFAWILIKGTTFSNGCTAVPQK